LILPNFTVCGVPAVNKKWRLNSSAETAKCVLWLEETKAATQNLTSQKLQEMFA
jgi:hypothetical protein